MKTLAQYPPCVNTTRPPDRIGRPRVGVVTRNDSLLEPGVFAYKYYARGIGVFLEVNPEEAEVVQLVGCNFDPRCSSLSQP